MKLSEQPEYRLAVPALAANDLVCARSNLQALLHRAECEFDPPTRAYLNTLLAQVEARAGNATGAHHYYDQAIDIDPHLHTRILCVQGLAAHFPDIARERLVEAENVFRNDWLATPDDMTANWYAHQIEMLWKQLSATGQ